MEQLIRMANVVPMPLNCDKLENKGTKFFQADMVIVTSNHDDFGMKGLTGDGGMALHRRFPRKIEVRLKPEFVASGRTDLDLSKLDDDDQPWVFEIKAPVIVPDRKDVSFITVCKFETLGLLARWIDSEIQQHVVRAQRYETQGPKRIKESLELLDPPRVV